MNQLGGTPQRTGQFALHAFVIILLLGITRWWSHAEFLLNSDAVNYVRALEVFDLASYSPHPPGYVLFVLAGRAVNLFTHNGNLAYLIVIWFCQSAVLLLTLRFLRELLPPIASFAGTLVILFHPLFWYYGSMTSVYSAEATAVLVIALFGLSYHQTPQRAGAIYLGLALGLAGGVRQFTILFTLPALIYVFLTVRRWRDVWAFIAAAIAGILMWFIPLMILAGGWSKYNTASTEFFEYYLRTRSPLLSNNFKGGFYNITLCATALVQLIWPFIPLLLLQIFTRRWRSRAIGYAHFQARFWLFIISPCVVFYLLIHIGQSGYMIGILVPTFMASACVMMSRTNLRVGLLTAAFVACACFGGLVFAFAPSPQSQHITAPNPKFYSDPDHWTTLAAKLYKFQADFTSQGIHRWEGAIGGYLNALSEFPPDSTVSIYAQDREVSAFLWEYYSADHTLLYQRWPMNAWTCRGRLCANVEVDTTNSDIAVVKLSAQTRYVFVVDDRLLEFPGNRLNVPLLVSLGKAPILLTSPQGLTMDGFRIEWAR